MHACRHNKLLTYLSRNVLLWVEWEAGSVCGSGRLCLLLWSLTIAVLRLWSAWKTVCFFTVLVTVISRTMGSWQQNAKPVQRKSMSTMLVYEAASVNPNMVCNPHGKLVVLWDFISSPVRLKRSQIMWWLVGTLTDTRNILIALYKIIYKKNKNYKNCRYLKMNCSMYGHLGFTAGDGSTFSSFHYVI